jgi:hypothetical protein
MINIGLITSKQAKRQPNAWAVYDNTSQRRITFKELDDIWLYFLLVGRLV